MDIERRGAGGRGILGGRYTVQYSLLNGRVPSTPDEGTPLQRQVSTEGEALAVQRAYVGRT